MRYDSGSAAAWEERGQDALIRAWRVRHGGGWTDLCASRDTQLPPGMGDESLVVGGELAAHRGARQDVVMDKSQSARLSVLQFRVVCSCLARYRLACYIQQ